MQRTSTSSLGAAATLLRRSVSYLNLQLFLWELAALPKNACANGSWPRMYMVHDIFKTRFCIAQIIFPACFRNFLPFLRLLVQNVKSTPIVHCAGRSQIRPYYPLIGLLIKVVWKTDLHRLAPSTFSGRHCHPALSFASDLYTLRSADCRDPKIWNAF